MKIGIITHYNVHNHGALLQLYALKTVLENENNNVRALTFKKNFDFMEGGIDKKYDISIKSLAWYFSYVCKIGLKRTFFNVRKKYILDQFKKPLIGEYYSRAKNLDAVFIGSDEVFSIEAGVNPFFFGIGIPCSNIYTYAACCGPTDLQMIKQKRMEKLIKAGLEDIKKISVRDKNTYDIVKSVIDKPVELVCDPVILYGYTDEIEKAERKIKADYLLVYAYDNNMNNPEETKKIIDFAHKRNLKVISVGFHHKWCDKCVDGSPIDILGYFKYAKYVVTDTFHGSVMSLITNANFAAKIRGNKNKLHDLLVRFNLSERIVENFNTIESILDTEIDYKPVNDVVSKMRKSSMEYLKGCLSVEKE
jgi:hypothetical protein